MVIISAVQTGIPEEVLEAVLERHDIVEAVAKFVRLTKQGRYLKGLCPFHSEKTPSFTVTPERQMFYCYGCGVGGNVITFRMKIANLSFPEAVKTMAKEQDISLGQWKKKEHSFYNKTHERLFQAYELATKLYHFLLKNTSEGVQAMNYLRSRGITLALINQFQIGYAPDRTHTLVQLLEKQSFPLGEMEQGGLVCTRNEGQTYVDRFRHRIMFPIFNDSHKPIAFAGRTLGEEQPKYINSPETEIFKKNRVLYHFHEAKPYIREKSYVILFEGYGDVISAWENQIYNVVAVMGTALTESQVCKFKGQCEEVVVCYDGDVAGQAAALKAISIIEAADLHAKVATIHEKKDPDEFIRQYGGKRFMTEIINQAVSATTFKLMTVKKKYNVNENKGKIAYIQEAVTIISSVHSVTEREVHIRELALQVDVSYESLQQECNEKRNYLKNKNKDGNNNFLLWNNGRQQNMHLSTPSMLPAYHVAERQLLWWMLQDVQAAAYVHARLGEQFNIEGHAGIAAYLYAYYAQDKPPHIERFMLSLEDHRLEQIVSGIAVMDNPGQWTEQLLDDCIKEVLKFPIKQKIEQKRSEMISEERLGNFLRAAQIAMEINALNRQQN